MKKIPTCDGFLYFNRPINFKEWNLEGFGGRSKASLHEFGQWLSALLMGYDLTDGQEASHKGSISLDFPFIYTTESDELDPLTIDINLDDDATLICRRRSTLSAWFSNGLEHDPARLRRIAVALRELADKLEKDAVR
jgi:hypothetical protein